MADPYLTDIGWSGTRLRLLGEFTPGDRAPEILLSEREGPSRLTVPATSLPASPALPENAPEKGETAGRAGFEALVDVADLNGDGPLPGGVWDVSLATGSDAAPIGPDHEPGLDTSPRRRFLADSTTVIAYFGVRGTLAIDVGGRPHTAGSTAADSLAWNDHDDELVVNGHFPFHDVTMPVSATLALRRRGSDRVYEVIAALAAGDDGLAYTAAVPLTRAFVDDPLPRGTWEVFLMLTYSGIHRELRVLAPEQPLELQVWRRLRHTPVTTTRAPEPLAITVGRH